MRILFMGTPDIAAESLNALIAAGHDICAVFTRADKPVGRKQILTAPPVKQTAEANGIPVYQPRTLRDGSSDELIKSLAPDIIVVVAYGCIIPPQLLHVAKYGCINLHVSLLPKYRGSAPIQWAVLNGDAETGVTIMQLDEGLDTGDILYVQPVAIDPDMTSGELFDRVSAIGAKTLVEVLPKIEAGKLTPKKQEESLATKAPSLTKEMAQFDFTQPAAHIHNWVRGMNPWPMAFFMHDGKKIKVTASKLADRHARGRQADGGYRMGCRPPPESGGQPVTARYLAVKALMRQEQNGYANLVLDSELKACKPPLSPRDAAFASGIFYTVLERRSLLDWMLAQFSKRPLEKLDAPVRAILRAGLAQAKFMDVPLPAAVNESVKLAKAFGKTSAAGMVNAMLRRTAALDPKPEHWPDLEERLRTYYCLSQPIAALFAAQYPQDAEAMAAAFYQRRPTAIRVNPLRTTDEALTQTLQQEGHTVTAGPWPHCLLVMFNGNPAASKAFHAGQFHVQGLASQFAALCCDAGPGMRVLDLCAAPGGKSLTIAEQMQNRGELFSGEAMTGRVKLLKQAFDRCGIDRAKPYHGDATILNPAFGLGSFDRVLCDVPCSGLGVIGKKPDIREKTLDGIENLLLTQQKILQNGAKYLAPNGRLVYSTCTVNHHENEAQVRQFLQNNQDFSVIAPQIILSGMRVGECGTLFLPHETSTDGFFAVILERQKNC